MRGGRWITSRGRAGALVVGLVVLCLAGPPAAATPRPLFELDILLTVADTLPRQARRFLLSETSRIWEREGVAVRWAAAAGGVTPPAAALRVLVIARADHAPPDTRSWPVAELVGHTEPRAIAIASIGSAQRVVSEAARFRLLDPLGDGHTRLGLVLGRAVAHEIGHFLLATGTHAERGLMRATFDASDFVAVGADAFRLDEDASRSIRERLSQAPGASLPLAGFSYSAPR